MNRNTEAMIVLFEAEQDYEGAIVYLEEKLAQYDNRQSFQTLSRLFRISYLAGNYAQAADYMAEMLAIVNSRFEVEPGDTLQMHTLTRADFLIRYGDEFGLDPKHGEEPADETLAALLTLQKQGRLRPITWLSLAAAYAIKGDETKALAALNEAVDRGMRKYPYGLAQPVFRDLRDNSEFIAIEDRIETLLAEERATLARMEIAPYTLPDGYQPIPMSREQFQKFTGFYTDGNILAHVYIAEDGTYMTQAGQFPAFAVLPYESLRFYAPLQPDITAEFYADDDGLITHMIAGPENQKTRFKRYPTPPPAVEMSPDLFELYKGTYVHNFFSRGVEGQSDQDLWSAEIRTGDNGEMLIDFDDQPALEIVATSDTEFHIPGFDSRLTMFVNEQTGSVEHMTMVQDGREMLFERRR